VAKRFERIEEAHRRFIERQKIFFTGSAAAQGRVNVSPKGLDTLRVLGSNRVAYLDLTGSGNEAAAHLRASGRITLMFCAFEGPPMILRLYGQGRVLPRGGAAYDELLPRWGSEPWGARQIILVEVDLVQTSCGYAVPRYEFQGERPNLARWAEARSEEQLAAYRREHNARSIDGLPTATASEDS
jgi:hypothetical protein